MSGSSGSRLQIRQERTHRAGSHLLPPNKKSRTRTGCWNCRHRRKKCNEHRPVCGNCAQKGETCEWGMRLSFRHENFHFISETHPSMQQNTASQRNSNLEIVDITNEVIRDYWAEFQIVDLPDPSLISNDTIISTSNGARNSNHEARRNRAKILRVDLNATSLPSISSLPSPFTTKDPVTLSVDIAHQDSPASTVTSHSYDLVQSAAVQLLGLGCNAANITSNIESQAEQDHCPDYQLPTLPSYTMTGTPKTSEVLPCQFGINDGIFLPGSAYWELHSVLRSHIFDTARSAPPSRRPTPNMPFYNEGLVTRTVSPRQVNYNVLVSDHIDQFGHSCQITPGFGELTKQDEYILWKNWVHEISPWLDKFDNKCHFGHKLPTLARNHPHLQFSMLALSARQLERKNLELSSSASLALYQEAIHQLLPQLQSKITEVVASCVVLCVLEMMDCSPYMWRRHLDGCASLIQALGINGFSGGMEQALFWCFARMDVCGGLISSESPLISTASWTPRTSLPDAVDLFRQTSNLDMYANLTVFLCAQALELSASDELEIDFNRRWNQLFFHIDEWYINRPPEMLPILSQPPTLKGDSISPFPTLLFSNPCAISGNQLYHTAAIIMLQKKPRRIILSSITRPILWHARRICGISMSNEHHGCWTNCVQPIWIAGQVVSHHAEHQAILEIYRKIEMETGWGTSWRADDLKAYWKQLNEG
ncbi:hypothetical protein F4859DRAFT_288024 [Xylaria cf. heliscus]|nr:hypothetical protein F4859DRAFT_288024 [Xylaria cf. heliscus]